MKKAPLSSPRVVAIAMAAVVAVLITGLVFLAHSAASIGRESTEVVSNAVPSTRHLALALTQVREIDQDVDQMILARLAGRPLDRSALEYHRRLLGAELDAYRALPMDPDEGGGAQAVTFALTRFDAVTEEGVRLISEDGLQQAREFEAGRWRAANDHLGDSIRHLIVLNAREMETHAAVIDRAWRVALIGTVALGVACVLLSVFSGGIAIRAVRRHARALENRAEELELFSARVAHDLMAPLGSVTIAVQVAEQRSTDPHIVRLSARAMKSLMRLQATTTALLELARAGGVPTAARTPLTSFVPQLLDELLPSAEEARVELSSGPIPDVEVACSPGILSVLLSNLIRNAMQWMGDSPIRRVELQVSAGQSRVRFEVHDSGPGADVETERQLFQAFSRAAPIAALPPGVSLGLATVKRLAEAHGGAVAARPGKERGLVVWFELPLVVAERASA